MNNDNVVNFPKKNINIDNKNQRRASDKREIPRETKIFNFLTYTIFLGLICLMFMMR